MSDLGSFIVDRAEPPLVTIEGDYIISTFKATDNSLISLTFPPEIAIKLIGMMPSAIGEAARRRSADPDMAYTLSASDWSVVRNSQGPSVSFGLPGGMRLAFQFRQSDAERLAEELQASA